MTWAEILDLYMKATGDAPDAHAERWLHLNDAYRKVAARLDIDQLEEDVSTLTTISGTDYVAVPSGVYHILSLHNTTSGFPVQPEPSGMRGRERYYEVGTGMPASGAPRYYAMTNNKIYLRGTPDAAYTLNLRYKIQPTAISDSDLSSSPLTLPQWDLAIVAGAAASFMRLHPDNDQSYGDNQAPRSALLDKMMENTLASSPLPKDRERFDQRGRMFMPFYLRR